MSTFKTGDSVSWVSQANGGHTQKTGTVVAVIPSGREGERALSAAIEQRVQAGTHRSAYGGGIGRSHESYLVEVAAGSPRAKRVLYWPVVANLRRADSTLTGSLAGDVDG